MASDDNDLTQLTPTDPYGGGGSSRCSKSRCGLGTCVGFGIALVCLTISIAIGFPVILHNLIATMLPIASGSVTYDAWASPTATTPIYMQFWFFNLTNGDEFLKGSKAALDEIGPFTYMEHRQKGNITNYDNSTISYREFRSFHFQRSMSCCSEDTEMSMVNLAYFTAISLVRYRSKLINMAIEAAFEATDNPPVMKHTVREILWGYTDPTLKDAADIAKYFHQNISSTVGLFYGKNGTDDGQYLIFSGKSNINQLAQIDRWQGSMSLSTWDTKEANMINGSDGTMFPPFVDTSKPLYIYSTDICRSIYVTYSGPSSAQGIDLLRFMAPAEVFQNVTLNPDNIGFCVHGVCLDSGALNLSTCQPGVPAISSQPHFYQGAQQYIDGVVGLNPSPDCATLLDVEPHTGLVMHAAKKLQINLAVATAPGFRRSEKVVPVFMPLIWVNESATIDAASAEQFRSSVLLAIRAANAVQWASLALGLLCLVASGLACVHAERRRRRQAIAADYPEIGSSVQHNGTAAEA